MTEDEYRIAAFGAIRRAAEVARMHDATASEIVGSILLGDEARYYRMAARSIRQAIRAAIGSDKS